MKENATVFLQTKCDRRYEQDSASAPALLFRNADPTSKLRNHKQHTTRTVIGPHMEGIHIVDMEHKDLSHGQALYADFGSIIRVALGLKTIIPYDFKTQGKSHTAFRIFQSLSVWCPNSPSFTNKMLSSDTALPPGLPAQLRSSHNA